MGHAHILWGKSGKRRIESSELDSIVEHTDKFVCANCFDDDGVKSFIGDFYAQNSDERGQCSYCQNEEGVHLDYVAQHIYERVLEGWQPSHNTLPWEQTSHMRDIIEEFRTDNELLDDIVDSIPHNDWQWIQTSSHEEE